MTSRQSCKLWLYKIPTFYISLTQIQKRNFNFTWKQKNPAAPTVISPKELSKSLKLYIAKTSITCNYLIISLIYYKKWHNYSRYYIWTKNSYVNKNMFHIQNYQSSHYVSVRSVNFTFTKMIWNFFFNIFISSDPACTHVLGVDIRQVFALQLSRPGKEVIILTSCTI